MNSIRGMIRQASPDDSERIEPAQEPTQLTSAPVKATARTAAHQGRGDVRRPLPLPPIAPPEERKPLSTRVKPSLKKALEDYTKEIRDAGFNVTQELVLDALLRELRDNDDLRERIASVLVAESH